MEGARWPRREGQAGAASLGEPPRGLRNIARRPWPLLNGSDNQKVSHGRGHCEEAFLRHLCPESVGTHLRKSP